MVPKSKCIAKRVGSGLMEREHEKQKCTVCNITFITVQKGICFNTSASVWYIIIYTGLVE